MTASENKKLIEENKKAIATMDGKITSMEASMVTMGTNIAKVLEEMQQMREAMSTNGTIGANSTNGQGQENIHGKRKRQPSWCFN